jgi:hypothetical protein
MKPGTSVGLRGAGADGVLVRGGFLAVNGCPAHADCFIVCEAGARVELRSPYGALLLAWAEGRERGEGNLFGF